MSATEKVMKVLVVDDSEIMRRILRQQMASFKAEVVEAGDGRQALDALGADGDYDLVLLDWNMPELDGFSTLEQVKANPAIAHIPVIMVTTEAEKNSVIKAIRAGAASYVVKPFDPETLVHKVRKVLEGEA
jgi:two-component system chemotaxis response regulator CheY